METRCFFRNLKNRNVAVFGNLLKNKKVTVYGNVSIFQNGNVSAFVKRKPNKINKQKQFLNIFRARKRYQEDVNYHAIQSYKP